MLLRALSIETVAWFWPRPRRRHADGAALGALHGRLPRGRVVAQSRDDAPHVVFADLDMAAVRGAHGVPSLTIDRAFDLP